MKKFKDYKKEDAPANNTSGVANWNPLLGKSPRVMVRKKKKLDLVNLTNLYLKIFYWFIIENIPKKECMLGVKIKMKLTQLLKENPMIGIKKFGN